jgi:hypothetical protein
VPTRRQACLGRVHALASRVRDLPGRRRPTTSVSSASTVTPRAAAEATAPSALGRRHDGAGGAARADDGAQQPADQPARPRLLRRSRGRPGCLRRRVACGGARPGGRGAPAAASSRRPEWLIGRSPAGLAAPPSSHQLPPTHRWQRCRRGGRRAAAAGRRRGLRRRGEARPASAALGASGALGPARGAVLGPLRRFVRVLSTACVRSVCVSGLVRAGSSCALHVDASKVMRNDPV